MKACVLYRWVVLLIALTLTSSQLSFAQEEVNIEIKAISGLQYDIVRFRVPPGARIKLTFYNTDEMTHNIVFTKPGYREEIVNLALNMGDAGNEAGFVPTSDKVIAAIPLLNPDKQQTIAFQVPNREGVYPYVCTYPGHGTIMYGALYVTNHELPPLDKDVNIPSVRRTLSAEARAQKASTTPKHPYPDILPTMYRTFMPDCGPAGIAVGLLGNVSYCWDAGQCRLRYVWKGDFLDMEENWAGKGNEKAKLVGTVFYRDSTAFPFRIGSADRVPLADFQGYSTHKRYPTFKYTLDGVAVTERIVPVLEQPGIKKIMTFTGLDKPLWLIKSDQPNVNIYCNKGRWQGNRLELTPQEAQKFTITITENL